MTPTTNSMSRMSKDDIRTFYRALGHADYGVSELLIIEPDGRARIGFFDSEDAFVDVCSTWSGTANVFVGRNPRPARFADNSTAAYNKVRIGTPGAKVADIEVITALSIDIDPISEKGIPSTDQEHDVALEVAGRIAADYPGSIVVDSGNGAQVVFSTPPITIDNRHEWFSEQSKNWEAGIRRYVEETPGLRLDSVHDLVRHIKVPGTFAIKGKPTAERPRRIARIVGEVSSGFCDLAELFDEPMLPMDREGGGSSGAPFELPEKFVTLLDSDDAVRRIWMGERQFSSRSEADFSLIGTLLRRGYDPAVVKQIALQMPCGTRDKRRIAFSTRKLVSELATDKGKARSSVIAADAADDFLVSENLDGKLRRWCGQWWLWNGKIYSPISDEECRARVIRFMRGQALYRAHCTNVFTLNVMINLQADTTLPSNVEMPAWIRGGQLIHAPDVVALQNGLLDMDEFLRFGDPRLRPHSADFFTRTVLSYGFDSDAECPKWNRFLEEILPEEAARLFLQEWFGYNLVFDTTQHAFVIFEGEGANGKSVVCHALRHLLGPDNVSAVPLEVFGARFQLVPTLGKLANIVPEMGEVDRVAEGYLKPFTAGDPMQIDRKYKDAVLAIPTARLTFATNTRPRLIDRSDGIWRRLYLVPFPVSIPENEQNKSLEEELLEELPGIFLWAAAGLRRFRGRGRFEEPPASKTAKEDYRRETDPARAFIEDECVIDPRYQVLKDELYQKYRRYAEGNGYRPLGEAQFAKVVLRNPGVRAVRPMSGGQRLRLFEGIGLPGR